MTIVAVACVVAGALLLVFRQPIAAAALVVFAERPDRSPVPLPSAFVEQLVLLGGALLLLAGATHWPQ